MADLVDRVAKYSMFLHAYANDTQLYFHFSHNDITSSVDQHDRFVMDIVHWISFNKLKLNTNKAELLFSSSSHSCATLSGRYLVLQLGADTTVAYSHVRLFGVNISSDLSLDHHIFRMCVGCYY